MLSIKGWEINMIHLQEPLSHLNNYFPLPYSYVCRSSQVNACKLFFIFFFLATLGLGCTRLSLVVAHGGYSSLECVGFSLQWLLLLRSRGSRRLGFSSCPTGSATVACGLQNAVSIVVAQGLSCSTAWGIFLDQGLNPCPLHWQTDS